MILSIPLNTISPNSATMETQGKMKRETEIQGGTSLVVGTAAACSAN